MADLVPVQDVRDAARRIESGVHRTPVVGSRSLGALLGTDQLLLKCENLQKTGSFKVRGALNRLLTLDPAARQRGVVTISAGNHAQALAWAARSAGVEATVVMPDGASATKAAASQAYGAEVIFGGTVHESFDLAYELADQRGLTFVHPFDDPAIIAGQGTVGLEILDQVPGLATVVVPVGGGGQIAGICASVGALRPDVDIYGVEPEGAAAMRLSLDRGEASRLERVDSIADGLAAPMAGERTYAHVRERATDVVTVPDRAIAAAVALILARTKLLAEPAGAAGVAALITGAVPTPTRGEVIAVVTGGNVDLDRLAELVAMAA